MTLEEARLLNVEGINYAGYKETESSLYDSDKNRLFGSSERGFTFWRAPDLARSQSHCAVKIGSGRLNRVMASMSVA
jgi:hypothetical protein